MGVLFALNFSLLRVSLMQLIIGIFNHETSIDFSVINNAICPKRDG